VCTPTQDFRRKYEYERFRSITQIDSERLNLLIEGTGFAAQRPIARKRHQFDRFRVRGSAVGYPSGAKQFANKRPALRGRAVQRNERYHGKSNDQKRVGSWSVKMGRSTLAVFVRDRPNDGCHVALGEITYRMSQAVAS
jgi:hypothetical protein